MRKFGMFRANWILKSMIFGPNRNFVGSIGDRFAFVWRFVLGPGGVGTRLSRHVLESSLIGLHPDDHSQRIPTWLKWLLFIHLYVQHISIYKYTHLYLSIICIYICLYVYIYIYTCMYMLINSWHKASADRRSTSSVGSELVWGSDAKELRLKLLIPIS